MELNRHCKRNTVANLHYFLILHVTEGSGASTQCTLLPLFLTLRLEIEVIINYSRPSEVPPPAKHNSILNFTNWPD